MLILLSVKNYALIRELEFQPAKGLNVITGETGAGKSILLGALGLVLGQRADHSVLFNDKEKCIVEAHFDISRLNLQSFFEENELDYDHTTILRREINQGGKSRAFVNDTPVSLAVLKDLGEHLVEIQTQSSGVLIKDVSKQYELLDTYAGNEEYLKQYRKDYNHLNAIKKQLVLAQEAVASQNKENDYLQFQLGELTEFDPKTGEESSIEQEMDVLSHALEISETLDLSANMLSSGENGLIEGLVKLRNNLRSIQGFYPEAESFVKKIEEIRIDLSETARDFGRISDKIEQNPEKLELLSERWNKLNALFKKHGVNEAAALIEIKEGLEARLHQSRSLENKIEELRQKQSDAEKELAKSAEILSKSRSKVAGNLAKEITQMLNELEMPEADLKIELTSAGIFKENGADTIQIRFTANAGKPLQAIEKSASGGELSRVLFSSKAIIARHKSLPTLILDEADTGVSGAVADTMGGIMRKMASGMQLLAITHLPQVAAKGEYHYFVYKENEQGRTHSKIKLLDETERENAIASMLGGKGITDAALINARELLSR